jgi:hypothetical protein
MDVVMLLLSTLSIIIGIYCIIVSFVPILGIAWGFVPSIIGIVLGAIAGSTAGVVLNIIAIVIMIVWNLICILFLAKNG